MPFQNCRFQMCSLVFVKATEFNVRISPTLCGQYTYAKTKTQISAFVFATRIVQSLYFLNPRFHASGHLLCRVVQSGLGRTWPETPKTSFLTTGLNLSAMTPSEQMFSELKWLPFPERVKYHTRVMMYKILNNMAPEYLRQLFHICSRNT